ncbi:MAG: transketolase [Candidatus Eutrophobiaceae bacterium]
MNRRPLANAVRALAMDAVQHANSGHPGAPMGMADIAEVLWNDFLRHNPADPLWPNRDRFVLSNGHGSMLLYAVLHLCGYAVSMEDLKRFRRLNSATPGHPEYGDTPGVETTTGPLGQGLANAVGMAIAERVLAQQFNRAGFSIIDHRTWVSVGDGCLMEGISHEACSLAGTHKLGKLLCLYDDNQISIDGSVRGWFTDDTPARFEAYGWQVIRQVDGHDSQAIANALSAAVAETEKPSLICCRTIIGWGAPQKQGLASAHGAPLGEQEIANARKTLSWPHPPFEIPDECYKGWDARERGRSWQAQWDAQFAEYQRAHPKLAAELQRRLAGELPENWPQAAQAHLQQCVELRESPATRKAAQNSLNAYAKVLPELIGGSADLSESNLTWHSNSKVCSAEQPDGNYLHYGVREFAMAAINNGIAVHGGFIPYGGTFLVFSDYARNALRLAALMRQRNIFVLTHDSIGLGEDGPTHQPVEHAASLRLIPNLSVWRPADTVETAVAWQYAIERKDGPTALLLSRQGLPWAERSDTGAIVRGGYVLIEGSATPELILIATGSELAIAHDTALELNEQGKSVRVVSMPCTDAFDAQDLSYRNQVLPPNCRQRIAIEAGCTDCWRKYVGLDGAVLGIDEFGKSAPGKAAFAHFGITTSGLRQLIAQQLGW